MKMKNFEFSKYCTPAQLYLVIGVICIISGFFTNYSVETLLTQALFLVVWAWVLNWLCSKGFKAISWIIVLLPFIFFLFTYFLIKDVAVREGVSFASAGAAAAKPIGGNPGTRNPTSAPDTLVAKAQAAADKAAMDKANAHALAVAKAAKDKAICIKGCANPKNPKAADKCLAGCPK